MAWLAGENMEDTTEVIGGSESQKDRQYNDQK
jgi:hypothetical protein